MYQAIYLRAKEQLVNHLYQHLVLGKLSEEQSQIPRLVQLKPNYLYNLQTQIFQNILDDERLKTIGLTAQKFPLNSELTGLKQFYQSKEDIML